MQWCPLFSFVWQCCRTGPQDRWAATPSSGSSAAACIATLSRGNHGRSKVLATQSCSSRYCQTGNRNKQVCKYCQTGNRNKQGSIINVSSIFRWKSWEVLRLLLRNNKYFKFQKYDQNSVFLLFCCSVTSIKISQLTTIRCSSDTDAVSITLHLIT